MPDFGPVKLLGLSRNGSRERFGFDSLRKQPFFFALGPRVKKDGCFRRLVDHSSFTSLLDIPQDIMTSENLAGERRF